MTTSTYERTRPKHSYYCVDADDERTKPEPSSARSAPAQEQHHLQEWEQHRASPVTGFVNRWSYPDTVAELIGELVASGRKREAAAIRRVLGHDDDEAAMRAYVSRLWADDWDSPEDSVYDE
jgi:hypothetical protein